MNEEKPLEQYDSATTWFEAPRAVSPLAPGVVDVWRLDLALPESVLTDLKRLLSEDERQRYERFRVPAPRQQFLAARAALRLLLASYTNQEPEALVFATGPQGKPYLLHPTTTLRFNLSHSHQMALLALSIDFEVGVDVERIQPERDLQGLARRYFTVGEQCALANRTEENFLRGFYDCWTRKEAYLKALGTGLTVAPDQVEVEVSPGAARALLASYHEPAHASDWHLRDLPLNADGYAAALAVAGEPRAVRFWRWRYGVFPK